MDKQEFLLLIPAIIYGVAIVDLLKIFQHKIRYWELIAWGLLLMVIVINIWIELYQKLNNIVDSNLNFFVIIAQAIIYAQAAAVITPEREDTDTKEYYFSIRKTFFLILAAATAFSAVVSMVVYDDERAIWMRPAGIIMALLCAFLNKVWLRTVILTLVAALMIFIIFVN